MSPHQRLATAIGLVLVVAGLGFAWHYLWHSPVAIKTTRIDGESTGGSTPVRTKPPPPEFFRGQPPPDLVLLLSGQMYGYLQPCGCARPQLGGLERRFAALEQLRAKGWPVSAADLGDLAPKQTDRQGRLKFETSLSGLAKMNYAAVGVGLTEAAMSLEEVFGVGLNYQPPAFVAANLMDKDSRFPEMYRPWVIDQPKGKDAGLRVGYVGLIGSDMAVEFKKADANLTIAPPQEVLHAALQQVTAQKPDLLVLLFHGSRAEGKALAEKYPQFRVVLTLDDSDEPSALPEKAGETLFISVGHKGKYVGLVGVSRNAETGKLDCRYELAAMSEGLEPADDATNPARELVRGYVRQIYQGDFLSKWPRSSHPRQLDFPEAKYVGAAKCQQCHPKAFAIWSAARHSHAYENLEKDGRPLATITRKGEPPLIVGRQFDPECVRCHATGFDYKTGYVTEQTTPYLCRKCHDGDNDPKFKVEEYWLKIKHGRE
jgi:hypothetical protein